MQRRTMPRFRLALYLARVINQPLMYSANFKFSLLRGEFLVDTMTQFYISFKWLISQYCYGVKKVHITSIVLSLTFFTETPQREYGFPV